MNSDHAHPNRGRIEFFCGCMFAGKTTRLIARLAEERGSPRPMHVFKHALDTRYTHTSLATHDRRELPAEAVGDAAAIAPRVRDRAVVGIDEAHFFGWPIVALAETLRDRGCLVLIAGIDFDTWGQSFPWLDRLKQIADRVEVLETPCMVCGGGARYSQRTTPLVDGNIVGGRADFEPRCPKCFQPLRDPAPPVYEPGS